MLLIFQVNKITITKVMLFAQKPKSVHFGAQFGKRIGQRGGAVEADCAVCRVGFAG
jgi:hypothetical protein